jgi:hypothetical protein
MLGHPFSVEKEKKGDAALGQIEPKIAKGNGHLRATMGKTVLRKKAVIPPPPGQLTLFAVGIGKMGVEGRVRLNQKELRSICERPKVVTLPIIRKCGRPEQSSAVTAELQDRRSAAEAGTQPQPEAV